MTVPEAKQVLLAYRPWANDDQEPEMAEALAICRADPVLAKWFASHCEAQQRLREKLQGIEAPNGLMQQIISERRAQLVRRKEARRRLVVALACVTIAVSVGFIWSSMSRTPRQDISLDGYRNRMVRTVTRAYGMDVETNDLAFIRAHLAANQAPLVDPMPASLGETPLVGCGVLRWQDRPVAMICYRTAQKLPPGMKSDLVLFIANQQDVQGSADLTGPEFSKASEWFLASWRSGDKVYLLAAMDETELRKRF